MNSLIHGSPFCVIIYTSYKLSKKCAVLLGHILYNSPKRNSSGQQCLTYYRLQYILRHKVTDSHSASLSQSHSSATDRCNSHHHFMVLRRQRANTPCYRMTVDVYFFSSVICPYIYVFIPVPNYTAWWQRHRVWTTWITLLHSCTAVADQIRTCDLAIQFDSILVAPPRCN